MTDLRRAPNWIAIRLPGVPCNASDFQNQLGTLIEHLSIARGQPFWRYNVKTALRLLKVEINQTTDRQAFLAINEQLKGVKTVAMHGPEGTPFRLPYISQADDLRYEQEYSVSRIGEDLPESMSGNRGLELLPWNLKAELKAR